MVESAAASDGARGREHDADLARLAALRPIDDDFMRAMFQGQLPLAQRVLRTLTGVADLVLVAEEVQRDVKRLAGARSVVLDVYGEDTLGRRYDLEVQRADRGAEPRRARYIGSAMDVEALSAGQGFGELPERYVVFVTEDDVFGRGAGAYRFERADAATGVELGDGAHVVYANGAYRGGDELGALMHDFSCSDPDEMEDPALAERARYLKRDPEGVSSMCKMMEDMREEAMQQGMKQGMQQGMKQGMKQGMQQGVQQGLLAALRNLMANTGSGVEASMDALGVPQDDRPRFRELLAGS